MPGVAEKKKKIVAVRDEPVACPAIIPSPASTRIGLVRHRWGDLIDLRSVMSVCAFPGYGFNRSIGQR